ncbi:MAG: RagB/SusD family nutrient uptake outer membrane protein [Chitinophagaceae bacterium]|nr:MAG: RagB/SusD family nutrient uptake outer membrane protein [Chitinophagaceae bacterium]
MKKYPVYIVLLIIVFFTSCEKGFLNKAPLDQYSDANVWADSALTMRFVDNIYGNIYSIYDDAGNNYQPYAAIPGAGFLPMDITDEGIDRYLSGTPLQINEGQYNPSTGVYKDIWTGVYKNVRSCNLFLAHMNSMPLSNALKDRLAAEVKFLRALNYMQLYSVFGSFPIIDTMLTLQSDQLNISRGTDAECTAFILKDLDAAAGALPVQYSDPTDLGRATEGAAIGMKCRLLLNMKDYTDAAAAAQAVMNLGVYSLFAGGYEAMFYPENDDNSEVIFNKEYGSDQSAQVNSIDVYDNSPFFTGFGSVIDCPTQNIVDEYEMTDGLSWDQSPLYSPAHPYANRDPRLDASVMHDSSQWMGQTIDMSLGSAFNPLSQNTPTGYMIRKFLNPNYIFYGNNLNYQNCIMLRLAEIYLDYAECELKLGNEEEARKYVNMIRQRPGVDMPPIPAGQLTWDDYVRERTVELAFEGQRWNDIRRWGMGPQLIGTQIYGMQVQVDPSTSARTYNRVLVQKRVFDPKMYYFPIPQDVINKYPAGKVLQQNPGW